LKDNHTRKTEEMENYQNTSQMEVAGMEGLKKEKTFLV
jgi:hypothetical protein